MALKVARHQDGWSKPSSSSRTASCHCRRVAIHQIIGTASAQFTESSRWAFAQLNGTFDEISHRWSERFLYGGGSPRAASGR